MAPGTLRFCITTLGTGTVTLNFAEIAVAEGGTVISLTSSLGTIGAEDGYPRSALVGLGHRKAAMNAKLKLLEKATHTQAHAAIWR